jgi:hypothetical protein
MMHIEKNTINSFINAKFAFWAEKYPFLFYMLILFGFCLFTFPSCQKVININLNSTDPKLVIEAEISDQSVCKVKLSETINFDETNNFPPVTTASITIRDNLGNSENLTETSPGLYSSSTLVGVQGRTYTLTVTDKGKSYTANSTMSFPVEIDTITFQKMGVFGNNTYITDIGFTDPAGIKNYYRFIEIVNGITQNTIFIYDDRFDDGKSISNSLLSDAGQGGDNSEILLGDTVIVLLQCIDKGVYDYFSTLSQSSGGLQSSTPANPKSNFNNGALGYFNAVSVRKKSAIVN